MAIRSNVDISWWMITKQEKLKKKEFGANKCRLPVIMETTRLSPLLLCTLLCLVIFTESSPVHRKPRKHAPNVNAVYANKKLPVAIHINEHAHHQKRQFGGSGSGSGEAGSGSFYVNRLLNGAGHHSNKKLPVAFHVGKHAHHKKRSIGGSGSGLGF
ncbi:predicted protein [Nematostella vectensis]|uniref:Uncharacterized protein n=1 Tax=Nematostella vectensis TaxID=45351 RepID=A7RMJ4_NEMVE|nr:predicted protein [Nematostella vectensis]|eukprot:XP_001639418.1 predicted protein [Nematostella vectensis]